jgi:DNA-binding GntR family transcriptional regulator
VTRARGDDRPVENSTTRVTAEIRAAIVSGELPPRSRLRAEALASRFGTSRSPVREALLALEREGMVEVLPNRGAIVRSFDPADLVDLYRLRCEIEPYAAACAAAAISDDALVRMAALCDDAERRSGKSEATVDALLTLNDRFHAEILDAAASPRLAEAMKGAAGIPRQFRSAFWATPEQRDRSLSHHREILAGLRTRNERLTSAAMEVHLLQALEFLQGLINADERKDRPPR